jgi:predicted DNA-binding transcriptional regulator YafY
LLRGRRRTTARQLAEWLLVSERTVYRDISALAASGVPIQGEAGIGYRLASGFEVPPLMFTRDELEALVLGVRVVRAWGGPKLGQASERAMAKIEAVLPGPRRGDARRSRLFAPEFVAPPELGPRLDALREAIEGRRVVSFAYRRADGDESARSVRPLGLFYWGGKWLLGAWCELRRDFRSFRLDRMSGLAVADRVFEETGEVSLAAFFRAVGAEES